jgi:hypothetical protein
MMVLAEYSEGEPVGVALLAAIVYACIRKAEALAYAKFPASEIHNGRGDALKHAYLSALLFSDRGEDFATDFMNAHEKVDNNPPEEERMDRFNNAVGRHIAAANPTATDDQLGELCAKSVLDGETQVLTGPGKNTPSAEAYP